MVFLLHEWFFREVLDDFREMAYFQIFPTIHSTLRIKDPSNQRHAGVNDSTVVSH